jgi:hypothetical protein
MVMEWCRSAESTWGGRLDQMAGQTEVSHAAANASAFCFLLLLLLLLVTDWHCKHC